MVDEFLNHNLDQAPTEREVCDDCGNNDYFDRIADVSTDCNDDNYQAEILNERAYRDPNFTEK